MTGAPADGGSDEVVDEGLDPLARTALWTAALRAREQHRSDRLFDDPLAEDLGGATGRGIMERFEERVLGGQEDPALAVRTRFFDDRLLEAAHSGIAQVVLVAAGMDARAHRLPWPRGTHVYELDRPGLLTVKERVLESHAYEPRCVRAAVGVDLTADWTGPLLDAGFSAAEPSAWLVEGLLYYLTDDQRDTLLAGIGALAAPSSRLMADYVTEQAFLGDEMQGWLTTMTSEGHPWLSGCDRPEQLLARQGWQGSAVAYGDDGADFGRWNQTRSPRVPSTAGRYLLDGEMPRGTPPAPDRRGT
jgi:methyltransferase (TIGR00027 family)